ncbi:hypothetical protein [Thalassotalea sediminis]|uniref:hypothetical protein n=1 Tax=Thalassotalea sediminis TaxID=1759089 RepID=UPI00257380F5|nr:hypothetical protein [Thalassotalea sediminis]
MLKWIIITAGVIVGFLMLILAIGYLLKDNELKHRDYIEQQGLSSEKRIQTVLTDNIQPNTISTTLSVPVIKNNLTCVNDKQCVVSEINVANRTCAVAINTIGAAQLVKVEHFTDIKQCTDAESGMVAVCQQNLCQLIKSDN